MECYRCNKQATTFSDFYALWINEGKGLTHVTMCKECFDKFDGEMAGYSHMVMHNVIKREILVYLYEEFKRSNHPKYYHLFDEWYKNLTPNQVAYFHAYSRGKKTIINDI